MELISILSGIYAVPIEIVAEALFEALLEFDSILPKSSTLKEIHIIDVNSSNLRSLQNICTVSSDNPKKVKEFVIIKLSTFDQTSVQNL